MPRRHYKRESKRSFAVGVPHKALPQAVCLHLQLHAVQSQHMFPKGTLRSIDLKVISGQPGAEVTLPLPLAPSASKGIIDSMSWIVIDLWACTFMQTGNVPVFRFVWEYIGMEIRILITSQAISLHDPRGPPCLSPCSHTLRDGLTSTEQPPFRVPYFRRDSSTILWLQINVCVREIIGRACNTFIG